MESEFRRLISEDNSPAPPFHCVWGRGLKGVGVGKCDCSLSTVYSEAKVMVKL